MKKYILFFMSIGLLLGIVLIYNISVIEKNKKTVFTESGYILNGAAERYYFDQNETYSSTYDSKISFLDTEKNKVVLGTDNFIHYSSGNICGLQDSVLLILGRIIDDPITYYNINAKKEIKKVSNGYILKNLKEDIVFEQAICKISNNKYIVLGKDLKIHLNSGTTRETKDYVELEYFDNEIVKIYNQEIQIQTVSLDSYIELDNNIKIKLGTKIISKDDKNRMSLEDMVINSEDNVTLIDINDKIEDGEEKDEEENTLENNTAENKTSTENNTQSNSNNSQTVQSTSTVTTTTNDNNNSTVISTQEKNSDDDSSDNDTNSNDGKDEEKKNETTNNKKDEINIETPDILYEYVNENESKVDTAIAVQEPSFKLQNLKVNAVGISGNIQIEDKDDVLSKDDNIKIKIKNNDTGKTVYTIEEPYGTYSIPLFLETLIPNTNYTITATASYEIDEQKYSKDFLNKSFVTSDIGLKAIKEFATDTSLGFNLMFSNKLVDSVEVTLLDDKGNELANRNQLVKNNNKNQLITFEALNPNNNYTMQISKIKYDGIIQEGSNWVLKYKEKTLKQKPKINSLNYSLNKRDSTITLYIDDIEDKNNAIQSYKYIVYKFIDTEDENNEPIVGYDTDNIVYEKETNEKQLKIKVGNQEGEEELVRNQYYGFKVIANSYDNEKYTETESDICGAFALNGATFPIVKFQRVESETPATQIKGWINIIDNDHTIIIDENNPLTINYESEVDEKKTYKTINSMDIIENTIDDEGNNIIKIWVNLGESGDNRNGLKKETTYNFSVYGTLDLKDGNDEYKNAYIGSCLVTTSVYNAIKVNFNRVNAANNAFTIELNLEGEQSSKQALTSLNILLYEGSGDIHQGEYNNWSRTITKNNFESAINNAKYNTEINSLQDLLFDNTLVVTPSFIGGGKESNYKELNYQVVVTATVDGTSYKNEIPVTIKEDDDDSTGDTYYLDSENNRRFSASYIIVNGKGSTEDILGKKDVSVVEIKNSEANMFSLEKNTNLDNDTVIGYQVDSNFSNTATLTAKEVTYYVWDSEGNPVLNGNEEQLTQTLPINNQENVPTAVFEVKRGTLNSQNVDDKNGLYRGNTYFFSYTIKYIDADGGELIWPMCLQDDTHTYTNKTQKSQNITAKKQKPRFVFYPKISDNNSITYKYSCSDYDYALEYEDASQTNNAYLCLFNGENLINDNMEIDTNGQINELIISSLTKNETYTIKAKEKINKSNNSYDFEELVKQKFEGINSLSGITIDEVKFGGEGNINIIKAIFSGENVEKLAGVKFVLDNGTSQITTELIEIINDENTVCAKYDISNLIRQSNFKNFINRDIQVKVIAYYDSGIIGFETNDSHYVGYMSEDDYLTLNTENNSFEKANSLNGNMYKSTFSSTNSNVKLSLASIIEINNNQVGKEVSLLYSDKGLKQNGMIVVQKELHEQLISETGNIIKIVPQIGIKVDKITASFITANITANIINPLDIELSDTKVEIWSSNRENDTPNWQDATEVDINENEMDNIILDDLEASKYYYIRFKYKDGLNYKYFYDITTKEEGRVYKFETIATFGINDINVKYVANKYVDKYLDITYKIDSSKTENLSKVKYTFYKEDGTTKIDLKLENIVNDGLGEYEIDNGSLISTKNRTELIEEKINIRPEYNVFDLGEKYIIKITPIIMTNEGQARELENVTHLFNLSYLKMPITALRMKRRSISSNETYNYVSIVININDTKCSVYGADWGEYNLHIYRYTNNENERQEINYYNSITGGTNLKGTTFDLQNHATNFCVYLQKQDVDYSYNYVAEIVYKYDSRNKGLDSCRQVVTKYTLSAINNQADIDIGTASISKIAPNYELRLYETYGNINAIDRIEYSILKISDGTIETDSFSPNWSLANDDVNGISYYKADFQADFQLNQVYILKMNLYINEVLVGQIDMTYVNEE